VCAALQEFAIKGVASRVEAGTVSSFLMHDRTLHHLDEEEDLFPAMRRRALAEDDLDALLIRLRKDHRRSDILAERIVTTLSAYPDRDHIPISTAEAELMSAYANSEHRHLAIENGVLLVIAQIRLNRKDLQKMAEGMKTRRGMHP
jgi:hemerythrin-like domain-containing protein